MIICLVCKTKDACFGEELNMIIFKASFRFGFSSVEQLEGKTFNIFMTMRSVIRSKYASH